MRISVERGGRATKEIFDFFLKVCGLAFISGDSDMSSVNVRAKSSERLVGGIRELKSLLGTRASDAEIMREHHSHGESYHRPAAPDVVCFPTTAAEVSEIMKISATYGIPVIPFGAGTSLEGQVVNAIQGGITIDLRKMDKILRVNPEDMDVTVEAGVTRLQLNKALEGTGLTFFIDPGADCSLIGGMVATRASGTTAVRYGHDAGERAGPEGGQGGRATDSNGDARAQVFRRLRSDAVVRGVGGHGRSHSPKLRCGCIRFRKLCPRHGAPSGLCGVP